RRTVGQAAARRRATRTRADRHPRRRPPAHRSGWRREGTRRTRMSTDVVKLVTFQLGLDLFGADVLSVDRVLRYSPPNAVPDVPSWIQGVVEHRGSVIPVVDLRRRVELSDDSITPETRMLVFKAQDGYVCAVVDMVHEVSEVATS